MAQTKQGPSSFICGDARLPLVRTTPRSIQMIEREFSGNDKTAPSPPVYRDVGLALLGHASARRDAMAESPADP